MASHGRSFLQSQATGLSEHSKEQAKPVFLVCVRVPVDAVRTARVDRSEATVVWNVRGPVGPQLNPAHVPY